MAATIKDIARKLNISVSTVSYALNGGPRPVAPAVRDRVLAVANELEYRPNRLARSLITGRKFALGVVPQAKQRFWDHGLYFHSVLDGIAAEAESRNHDIILYTRFLTTNPKAMLAQILDGRADAVIFLAAINETSLVADVAETGMPCAVISSDAHGKAIGILCDDAGGIAQGLDHLYELGHRRIGYVSGDLLLRDAVLREEAFFAWMKSKGIEPDPHWILRAGYRGDRAYELARTMLSSPERPTAMLCANDEMGAGVVRAAQEIGLHVPCDLSVVGFDNSLAARTVSPRLTTIEQPLAQMGEAAVRAVLNVVEGDPAPPVRCHPTKLVFGASTAPPEGAGHRRPDPVRGVNVPLQTQPKN